MAMPSVVSCTELPQQQQQRPQSYIPKLLYRNASSQESCHAPRASVSSGSTAITFQTAKTSTAPPSPLQSEQSPTMRSPSLPSATPSPRSNTLSVSTGSPGTPTKSAKKKSSSFFGFLTVKEPSAQGFLDYQEHLRKQAQTHNGRITAIGMPGISSAKLPPTVPKVNSKWDGVPQGVKQREKEKEKEASKRQSASSAGRSFIAGMSGMTQAASKPQRGSSSTLGSQGSLGNPGTGSSIFSNSSASQSSIGTKSGWENASISSGSDTKDFAFSTRTQSLGSPSPTTLPEPTSFLPSDLPKRPAIVGTDQSGSSTSVEISPILTRQNAPASLPALVPTRSNPSASPCTIALTPCEATAWKHEDETSKITIIPSSASETKVLIKSAGANVLGPPAAVRKMSKAQPSLTSEEEPIQLLEDEQPTSILKRKTVQPESQGQARPPISSYFPNAEAKISGRPRQRPVLGMNVGSKQMAPWESPDSSENGPDSERILTPTPQGRRGLLKRGRLAIFSK
ncbi:MAG: hypothetical protein M1830_008514 [Pleopsidium flavum]|nr:MAG: hypothetical protein M1830_008514 [Pleopsidium flavum]